MSDNHHTLVVLSLSGQASSPAASFFASSLSGVFSSFFLWSSSFLSSLRSGDPDDLRLLRRDDFFAGEPERSLPELKLMRSHR